MMPAHKCPTRVELVALELATFGFLDVHQVVFGDGLRCPQCGLRSHDTRVATSVFDLRRDFGWDISTERRPGKQAIYRVQKVGTMPTPMTPTPVLVAERWYCTAVQRTATGIRPPKKGWVPHDLAPGAVPSQPTTDESGSWTFGQCLSHGMTVWRQVRDGSP